MWNINCILYSMNNLCFHDNTFLLPAMLRWGKQLNIWPFCESDDKISTLRQQQQKWAHQFLWQIVTIFVFIIFEEWATIFMHEFVKIQDISITGLAKMSPKNHWIRWRDFIIRALSQINLQNNLLLLIVTSALP